MQYDVKFIDNQFYQEQADGSFRAINMKIEGNRGGGLSRNAIINLIGENALAYNEQAIAADDITTSSTADVVATGMTLTPPAGTYLVWFSGSVTIASENTNACKVSPSIFSNNSQIPSSEESLGANFNSGKNIIGVIFPFNCVAKVTVNGTQTIEGRWKVDDSNADPTMHQRNLTAIKVKP